MLNTDEFIDLCKEKISENIYNLYLKKNILLVWYCKTIQNHKALFHPQYSKFYVEYTYNGDKEELYIDIYKKQNKIVFKNI